MPVTPPIPSRYPGSSSDERLYQRLQFRQDTLANWLRTDPILASGEMGYVIGATEEDRRLKVGDGTRRFSELPWVASRGPSGPVGPQGPQGPGPVVYKQSQTPADPTVKDGDVWLQPIDSSGAPVSMAAVQEEIERALQILRTEVTNEVTNSVTNEVTNQITQQVTNQITEQVTNQITNQITNTTVTESVSREVIADEVAKQLSKLPPPEPLAQAEDSTAELRESIAALEKSVRYIQTDFLTDPSNVVSQDYKIELIEIIRTVLNGGKTPPLDRNWTECPKIAGAGLVEARVVNGVIQLRGRVDISTKNWVALRRLPQHFPMPAVECDSLVTGGETGVAERACIIRIKSNGEIWVNSFAAQITYVNLYPARAEAT